ncbi:MAG: DUF3795 domain-containing protein [Candidatus Cloacimonetes bacterium]|nr:DUF3795 domain-containing protein [Candidatus Cloacimonadota bacterium]
MERMISACGLICNDCLAYKATQADDDSLREKTAQFWTSIYGVSHKKEDINCDGCMNDGKKFGHCLECEIRLCAIKKGYKNCAQCELYPCEDLVKFHENVPMAKLILDDLRKQYETN